MNSQTKDKILDAVNRAYRDNILGGKYEKAFRLGVECAYNRVNEYLLSDEVIKMPDELDEMVRWYGGVCIDSNNNDVILQHRIDALSKVVNINAGVLVELIRTVERIKEDGNGDSSE